MDKAEIRAKAVELMATRFLQTSEMEAALTAAYDAGWNEAVEAALQATQQGVISHRARQAIRRLKKGQGV